MVVGPATIVVFLLVVALIGLGVLIVRASRGGSAAQRETPVAGAARCAHCGHVNEPGARFCAQCGHTLNS